MGASKCVASLHQTWINPYSRVGKPKRFCWRRVVRKAACWKESCGCGDLRVCGSAGRRMAALLLLTQSSSQHEVLLFPMLSALSKCKFQKSSSSQTNENLHKQQKIKRSEGYDCFFLNNLSFVGVHIKNCMVYSFHKMRSMSPLSSECQLLIYTVYLLSTPNLYFKTFLNPLQCLWIFLTPLDTQTSSNRNPILLGS